MHNLSASTKLSAKQKAISIKYEQAKRLSHGNLLAFTGFTKRDYQPAAHHNLMAHYLQQIEQGEITRLMIFMPPRHGKSELTSRRFPAWYLGRNPNKQIIAASYNSDLAASFGRDVRNLVSDELYQDVFPGMGLRQDSKAADRWNTTNGGSYLSAGVGSGITGHGADLGIIDDPFKDRAEANSQRIRDNVWNWYASAFYTRLMPNAAVVLTVTRWHEDDLAGRLIKAQASGGGEPWTVLSLPAIATGPDQLGRIEGDPLWPAWYPTDTLEKIKSTVGNYEWASLYQQSPYIEEGNIFKRHYWQYFREVPDYGLIIQSWDTAFKTGAENDFSVCTTWGMTGNNIHLLDVWKGRLEFPELKRKMVAVADRYNPDSILVEDKASGQSLIQELRRSTMLPIIPVKVDRDNVTRAYAITPLIEGGRVYLPEWATWKDEYINVMASFPSGAHDDEIDSTSQALEYLRSYTVNVKHFKRDTVTDWDPFSVYDGGLQ